MIRKPKLDDPKFDQAKALIDKFAVQLLTLNGDKAIPRTWKNHLLKAIAKTKAGNPGKQRDYAQVAEVVRRLTLVGDKVRLPRTKHHNPATFKDKIAKEFGISRKTVERIDKYRPEYMRELNRLDSLGPDQRKAYIEGLSDAIWESIKADDEEEQKARQRETHRRVP